MFRNNELFETMSDKMDDDFNKTAKKMVTIAIIGNFIILSLVALFIIGLLYLIKVWFFGGF